MIETLRSMKARCFLNKCLVGFALAVISVLSTGCSKFLPLTFQSTDQFSSSSVASKTCGTGYAPGHVTIHRLSDAEYNNTVRDLLFTSSTPANSFPPDGVGASGFTNDSDRLSVYDELVVKYGEAADTLAAEVIASKSTSAGAYSKIAPCAVGAAVPSADCALTTVRTLATRAFRRPVESGPGSELSRLMDIFSSSGTFDTGLQNVISALLISPNFIFASITSGPAKDPAASFLLNGYELASRLSYFLWASMPDDELFGLAASGQLLNADTVKAQVQRMLHDPKVAGMVKVLRNDWLALSPLNDLVSGLDDGLRTSMVQETDLFLGKIIRDDMSVASILNAEFTYVNKTLADLYGVPFRAQDPAQFVLVDLSNSGRMGVLGQAGFLTVTAGARTETHPVKRGHAVSARVMCTPVPPPPPNIPVIPAVSVSGLSPKLALETHTRDRVCFACHQNMDAVGLGLESFGPFGQFRTQYANTTVAVDPSGVLPDGHAFGTAKELLSDIAGSNTVHACVTKQVASLAVTRAMVSTDDKCVVDSIAETNAGGKLSDLISEIVFSRQFRMQTGEAP